MNTGKTLGRIVGTLMFLHLALGLIVPFALLQRLKAPPGFLLTASGMPNRVRGAVMLLFLGSAFAIAIACAALRIFRQYSSTLAYSLMALAVTSFSLQAVDNAHLMSMLSLSQEYAVAGAEKAEVFQALATMAGAARKWSHYSFLLVVVTWIFLLCSVLYRFRLVPRVLAAFGMIACVLQIAGVTLRGFWGLPPDMRLAMPMGPAYGGLAVWLMVKGFYEGHRPVDTKEYGVGAAVGAIGASAPGSSS